MRHYTRPSEKPYKLTDTHGLFLYIHPNGGKYWRLKFRYMGKEKGMALGVFPDVSLADAREKRAEARKLLLEGINPAVAKQNKKRDAEAVTATTFELVAREWHQHNHYQMDTKIRSRHTPTDGNGYFSGNWSATNVRDKAFRGFRGIT